jgi:hypothetical protein
MHRWHLGLALGFMTLAVAAYPSSAKALAIMPAPGPQRVTNSDVIIVGKVVGIEPQDVMVMNVNYRIAVVKVDESLRGLKDAKQIRVAFMPPPMNFKPPIIRPGFRGGIQLAVNNAGLFMLKKHEKENFYVFAGPAGYFISSENNQGFDGEVKAVKAIAKVAENPKAALKSKNAEERLLAASVLVETYRTFRGVGGQIKQEPIDADESKQIMLVIAEADWKQIVGGGSLRPNPVMMFSRLGITQNDGFFVPPGSNYQQVAQTWLRDNAGKYRIQRFVAADGK